MNNIELAELLRSTADKLVEMTKNENEKAFEIGKALSVSISSPKKIDLSSIDKPFFNKEEIEEINEIVNKPKESSAFTEENGEKLLSIRDRTVYNELEHVRLLISKNNNDIQTLCEYAKNEILEGHNLNMKSIDNSFKEIDVTLDKIKESKKIINNLHNVDYDLKMFNK